MKSTEQLLEQAAEDGSFDSDTWPAVLEDICKRIDTIVQDTFPRIPLSAWQTSQTASQPSLKRGDPLSQESQVTDKENAPPPSDRPPVPPFNASSVSSTQTTVTDAPYVLPPELAQLHQSIKDTLRKYFPSHPPYTIQRFAELILWPQRNYRFVGPYLRALDRVVNVSSNVTQYPLATTNLLNGSSSPPTALTADELGSDESLGGALLTPIPWLNRSNSSTPSSTPGRSRANTAGSLPDGHTNFKMNTTDSELVLGPDGKLVRVESVEVGPADVANAAANQQLQNEAAASTHSVVGSVNNSVAGSTHDGNTSVHSQSASVHSSGDTVQDEEPKMTGPEDIDMTDTGKVDGLPEIPDKDANKESSGDKGSGSRPSTARTANTAQTSQSSGQEQKQKPESPDKEDGPSKSGSGDQIGKDEPSPKPDAKTRGSRRPGSWPGSRPGGTGADDTTTGGPTTGGTTVGGTTTGGTTTGGTTAGGTTTAGTTAGGGPTGSDGTGGTTPGGNGNGGDGDGGDGNGNEDDDRRGNVNEPGIQKGIDEASTAKDDEDDDRLPDDNDIEMTDD